MEPILIGNPQRLEYRFLFNAPYNEENTLAALDFIDEWVKQHGWQVKKEKRREIPEHGYFEIRTKLCQLITKDI